MTNSDLPHIPKYNETLFLSYSPTDLLSLHQVKLNYDFGPIQGGVVMEGLFK